MNLTYPQRLVFLAGIGAFGVVFIVLGLIDLQVVNRDMWAAALEHRSSFDRRVRGERGRILDAGGEILARDVLGYDLMMVTAGFEGFLHECRRCGHHMSIRPGQHFTKCPRCRTTDDRYRPALALVDDRQWKPMADILGWSVDGLKRTVAALVERNQDLVAEELAKSGNLGEKRREDRLVYLQRKYGWQQLRVKTDVPYEAAREVVLHPERNPAFRIREGRVRRNVGGPGFAQIIGRRPDPVRRAQGEPSGSGLELVFDELLRGEAGVVERVRDKKGRLKVTRTVDPIDGASVQLTMSRRDQESALEAVRSRHGGALVVVDAETGAVLAAASAPSYEPGDFNRMWKRAQAEAARKVPRHVPKKADPRINRALRGWYAPGSTLKPFTALAALRFGAVAPSDTVDCHRLFTLNGKTFSHLRCHDAHGETDLRHALVKSCNVYFQTAMHHLLSAEAEAQFQATCEAFGFGKPTGIEIEPADWVDRMTFRVRARDGSAQYGMRLQHAIGQGYVTATPAQVARAYAGLMTGRLPRLHMVRRRGSRETVPEHAPIDVPPAMLEQVREALRATNDPGESLAKHGLDRYEVACKTGTAQTGHDGLHTTWIAGFGDARGNRPKIAFALVIEHSPDHGGEECGPRLARFLRAFYREDSAE